MMSQQSFPSAPGVLDAGDASIPGLTEGGVEELRSEVTGLERQVPLLDGGHRTYVNLDNAASTPMFGYVQAKVNELLEWYSSVHRGTGFKSLLCTEIHEIAREIVADFVGANTDEHAVIFGKNTTEAINKLANRMPLDADDGDMVLTTVLEHHSNDLPWRKRAKVLHARANPDGTLDLEDFANKLATNESRIKLVSVTGASNVTGYLPPIYELAELAHRHGVPIMVDCAQLAPHRSIDMGALDAPDHLDFVSLSAHKMYAPLGAGALIGPKHFFESGAPDYVGGGTIDLVSLEEVHWAAPPERDEAGSPNLVGIVALAASMQVLSAVGMDSIADHERVLTQYALERLNQLPGVTLYGPRDFELVQDRVGVIPFQVDGMHHAKIAAILGFEGGIGVRNGCFCAHPYVIHLLGVNETEFAHHKRRILEGDRSQVPGLVRLSFGCYNTCKDVDRLVSVLRRIVDGDYAGEYVADKPTGFYWPRGFDHTIFDEFYTV
jgi:selenocysteine lyase/cysteine desulfurase